MKRVTAFCALGIVAFVFSQACGSSDDKKKARSGPKYPGSGGEAGEATGSGAKGSMEGGEGGEASGGTGSGATGNAAATDGGTSSVSGDAGRGGALEPVPECPAGKGECDGNPDTVCERNVTLVTSCGDCDTKCGSMNAAAACLDGKCQFTCLSGFDDCDGKPENGCETALANNPEHCGACSRDCATHGATCMTNACSVVQMQQDVGGGSDVGVMRALAFSPFGIFNAPQNNYVIRRFPLEGVGSVVIWQPTSKASPTESLLVEGNEVYWAERGAGQKFTSAVFKKAVTADATTMPTTAFMPEFSVTFLRKQGNALYWASGAYQDEVSLPGGGSFIYTRAFDAASDDPGTLIMGVNQGAFGSFQQLAVTTDALYWVTKQNTGTQYELRTAPLSGSPVSVVPAVFPNVTLAVTDAYALNTALNPVRLEPVGEWLYFNRDANDAQDGIYRYKTGLEQPERIVLAANVRSLLVDGDYVYFLQTNVAAVWRVAINDGQGAAAEKISATGATSLAGIDENYVYAATISAGTTDFFKVVK